MDRQEFAKQYTAIFRRLWLLAVGIVGDRAEAEDIVQEAAVIAFQKRSSFKLGTSFGAWVARIVRLCAANHNRKRFGRQTQTADPASLDEHIDSSAKKMQTLGISGQGEAQTAFDDRMLNALSRLSEEARACLLLRVVDGLSYREISELLEIPEGTAMSHVHRSKKTLRGGYLGDDRKRKGEAV